MAGPRTTREQSRMVVDEQNENRQRDVVEPMAGPDTVIEDHMMPADVHNLLKQQPTSTADDYTRRRRGRQIEIDSDHHRQLRTTRSTPFVGKRRLHRNRSQARIIDTKTLHMIGQIAMNTRNRSRKAGKKKLSTFWHDKGYLIINEKSMLSRKFLARVSSSISTGKSLAPGYDLPTPLGEEPLGASLYEQFKTVVRLTEQVRVNDTEWLDLLPHVRNGSCRAHHIAMLRSLITTNPLCPPTDFATPPWSNAVLITPRHSVRRHWNTAMTYERSRQTGHQLFVCRATDTIGGRPVTLADRFAIATKTSNRGNKHDEHGGPPTQLCY
ncbi:hypothetical protein J3R82DRAFT_10917 [Butyriboletus roseoflavus]|nr:hypothetical protein J3R82DRAFT_10917 [Butyriboletus roseoflavus]